MKKQIILLAAVVLTVCVMSCVSTGGAQAGGLADFSNGQGKDWKLLEVHIQGTFEREILFDRKTLSKEGDGNIFTMKYDGERIAGIASPNRFNAPYTLGEDQSIEVKPGISTQMAPLFQPEKLGEHQFLAYLHSSYKWSSVDKALILHSKTEDGREVRMIFGQ